MYNICITIVCTTIVYLYIIVQYMYMIVGPNDMLIQYLYNYDYTTFVYMIVHSLYMIV